VLGCSMVIRAGFDPHRKDLQIAGSKHQCITWVDNLNTAIAEVHSGNAR
jgi:hypothetical protein